MNHSIHVLLVGSDPSAVSAFRQSIHPRSLAACPAALRVCHWLALIAVVVLGLSPLTFGQVAGTALVRRAPTLNGGTIDGSLQLTSGENVTLGGSVAITGDLLVPGTPVVRTHGNSRFDGTIDGPGDALPSGYDVTLGGKVSLRNVVRRTNPAAIASVGAPRAPTGTQSVVFSSPNQGALDFATVRDLTLTPNAGQIAVPPGAYGAFTADAGSGFTLGIAGASAPAQYDFERLNLAAGSQLQVAGPVIITVRHTITAEGVLGSAAHPSWLTLKISSGGLTLSGAATLDGSVNAPAGSISLNGNARLSGAISGDSLSLVGNPMLRLANVAPNAAPTVALATPEDGTVFTAPASMLLSATANDADGTIAKVEFYQGAVKIGEALVPPFEFVWANVPPGAYTLTARAYDNAGASATSAPRSVTVRIGLPYFTGFEASDGYVPGSLSGQVGWTTSGDAALIDAAGVSGSRAVLVGGSGASSVASHSFPDTAQSIACIDLFARPVAGVTSASSVVVRADGAHVALVRSGDRGEIMVFRGNGTTEGTWTATGLTVPLGVDGRPVAWLRLTLREDFGTQRWDLYVDRQLCAYDIGFTGMAAASFTQIAFAGPATDGSFFDDLYIGFAHPLFVDADGDGLDDEWESQNGLSPLLNDRLADPDGDGKSNLAEYQAGTNPQDYFDGLLPQLVSSIGPNLRPGAAGLVAVRVTRPDGTLLVNAPIEFEVTSGGILISTTPAGTSPAMTAAVRSDAQGMASVYVQYLSPAAPLSTLIATARSGTQTRTLTISVAPPIVDTDADGLDDDWERRYLGGLDYSAGEDPGGIGRTLAQSHFQDSSPWPAPVVGNGLQLWYRGDLGVATDAAGKVSRWADLSGNAIHVFQSAVAAQPVAAPSAVGGQSAVRFDGVASTLRTLAAVDLMKGSNDVTVVLVVKVGASQREYADILDYNHGTFPYGGFVVQSLYAQNQYGFGWRNNNAWVGLTPTVPLTAGAPQLLEFVKNGESQSAYLDSALVFSTPVPTEMLMYGSRIFSLGSFVADNTRCFNGEIAEVLIYNRALSAAERTVIGDACRARYFAAAVAVVSDR